MDKNEFKTVEQFDKEINWLEDFYKRWEKSEDNPSTTQDAQNALIDEYAKFIKDNNLPEMSCDELISELKAQRECTRDNKF